MSDYTDKAKALKWRKSTMVEAIKHASARTMLHPETPSVILNLGQRAIDDAGVILFTDGTGIAVLSDWSGPYSRLTPDTDGEPPEWFIGGAS